MAELADAYGSGPYERKLMQVQVLLSAPKCESLNVSYKTGVQAFLFVRNYIKVGIHKSLNTGFYLSLFMITDSKKDELDKPMIP